MKDDLQKNETATKKVGPFTAKWNRQNVWKNVRKVFDSDRQTNFRTNFDQPTNGDVKVSLTILT